MHEYVLPCTQTYHVGFFYGHGSKAMEHVRHNNEAKCMGHLNHGLKTMDCVLQNKDECRVWKHKIIQSAHTAYFDDVWIKVCFHDP